MREEGRDHTAAIRGHARDDKSRRLQGDGRASIAVIATVMGCLFMNVCIIRECCPHQSCVPPLVIRGEPTPASRLASRLPRRCFPSPGHFESIPTHRFSHFSSCTHMRSGLCTGECQCPVLSALGHTLFDISHVVAVQHRPPQSAG